MVLEIKDLSQKYRNTLGETDALLNIEFSLHTGEILSILGPNGSGKSTLLKCIINILQHEGEVLIDGILVKSLKRKKIAKKIALLSQHNSSFFNFTVYERVKMGAYSSEISEEPSEKKVNEVLDMLDLSQFKNRPVNALSGGQFQRVLIAAALVQEAEVIMLDEPTNHLDIKYQLELIELLKSINKNKIIISVMHNIDLAMNLTDKMLVLNKGEIRFFGNSDELIKRNILNEVYETDIRAFTLKNMERWK
ncbi:MAG: ABC transporter ATP-binding protein [Defluviitaleaceae bacterium]|nr:ABC transporter ATP-binding protein [Defluviitaleaceae bacterium]